MKTLADIPSATRDRPSTIIDVAQTAGVAIGTVSRYLNDQPIRKSNREPIERAIKLLGYTRSSAAASMKTSRTHIVGFLVPGLGEFHAQMLEALSRRVRSDGRAVMSYCHDGKIESAKQGLDFFLSQRVDALVVNGDDVMQPMLQEISENRIPLVIYDNEIEDLRADGVFTDNRQVSKELTSHLLELGHERVATIHGNLRFASARERLAGFCDAFRAVGREPDPSLIVDGGFTTAHGYDAMKQLMELPNPPSAVFGANYLMTYGILAYARKFGLLIPDDMSVVSFDDTAAFSLHQPPITTAQQPILQMAEAIAAIIERRIRTPEERDICVDILPSRLMQRDSARRFLGEHNE